MLAKSRKLNKKAQLNNKIVKDPLFLLKNVQNKEVSDFFFYKIVEVLRENNDKRLLEILKSKNCKKELLLTKIFFNEVDPDDFKNNDFERISVYWDYHNLNSNECIDYKKVIKRCTMLLKKTFDISIFRIIINHLEDKKIKCKHNHFFKFLQDIYFIFTEKYSEKIPFDDFKKIKEIIENNKEYIYFKNKVKSLDIKNNEINIDLLKSKDISSVEYDLYKKIRRFFYFIFPKINIKRNLVNLNDEYIIDFFLKVRDDDLLIEVLEQRYIPFLYLLAKRYRVTNYIINKMKKKDSKKIEIKYYKCKEINYKFIERWK